MWNFTPLPYAHVSLQTWVSFWTLFCCVDLFFYLILSPNHHFSYSCNYSLMSDKASFITLYLKFLFIIPTCFLFLNSFFFFFQIWLKILLEIFFEICPSVEGNWLLCNIEFSHPGTWYISPFILAFLMLFRKVLWFFSNRFCTFLRVTVF